jgi:MtrB/PioB family decaheme-associated outer membrane protein
MQTRRRIAIVSIGPWLLALLFALPAAAQDEPPPITFWGSVEGGAYLGTEDSFKFGDFTGLRKDRGYGLANVELNGRAPWTGEDTWYFRFHGWNLALPSRSLWLEGGLQGLFKLYVEWDEIPKFDEEVGQLAFRGRGTDFLTLPSGWVPGTDTSGFTRLDELSRPISFSRDRRAFRAGGGLVLPRGFEFSTSYERERRTGRMPVSAIIGNSAGNPRSAFLPAPVDWLTHEADSKLRYADATKQFELGYELSFFENDNRSLTWQNPFSQIGGWRPGVGFPDGFGSKGLPPDNRFHQIYGSGGYNLPWWRTRVAGHVSYAWYRQNELLLPYTVNPALAVPVGLPRSRADAAIDATNVVLRVTSRPVDALRINTSYRFDDRDNKTPRDVFQYVGGDSSDQGAIDSTRARINQPFSYRLHEGRLDLAYEFFRRTELSLGYERRREERKFTEMSRLDDHIGRAGIRTRPARWVDFRVDGMYWRRDARSYFFEAPVIFGFSPEHVATVAPEDRFDNAPDFRKFNLIDRERYSVDSRLMVVPLDNASLGFLLGWRRDEFDKSELGLQLRQSLRWGFDLSWSPIPSVTTHGWYHREKFESRLRGRQFAPPVQIQAFDPQRDWRSKDSDTIDSLGVGLEWVGLDDRLRVGADYAYSRSKERIRVKTGLLITPADPLVAALRFPDDRSTLHDLSFRLEYKILERLTGRFGYRYQRLSTRQWAYDGVEPATLTQVLGLGFEPPRHSAHLFAFSLVYAFDL